MDFVKNLAGGNQNAGGEQQQQQGNQEGGIMGKVNNAMGGGQSGEQNEDAVDKGVDYVQEKFLGGGQQTNESAAEQLKDEQISDALRGGFKSTTGRDVPVADK